MRLALSRAVMAASLACAAGASGCTSTKSDLGPVGVSDKPGSSLADRATTYAFDALDDRAVSSAAHRGKPAILCFVTTGDIVGQAQVDYLVAMEKNDSKRVSYALVALHPRKEIVLVEAYVAALKVTFPVALGPPPVMG
ncbi:MAG: hypothetical protein JWP97_3112, partial [Labilithrix sp.]|nr:hypothetical protein [Labilithrix sp.]